MSLRRLKMVVGNTHAVFGQPIALLIIVFIAGVIITVLCFLVPNLLRDSQLHQVECEIDRILLEATNMFEYANNGSFVTVHVVFPTSLDYLVFGHLPSNLSNEPTNHTLDEATSNNYYVVMNDGTVRTYHSSVRFSNQNMTQFVLFRPGTYEITMELCQKEGISYVAMSERYP